MKNMIINLIVFVIIFLITVNWFQIFSFSQLIVGKKIKTSSVKDSWINKIVKKKTGLLLLDITIFHDKRMYGMMAGLPFWPKMILSEGLYKNFNKNELEWVILHEAGHCVLWHNLEAFIIELVFIFSGLYLIKVYEINFFISFFISVSFSLICIQVIRWTIEYAADKYSISRVANPRGVITAQDKFRKNYFKNPFNKEGSILRFLLHWNITYTKRIEMARKRFL